MLDHDPHANEQPAGCRECHDDGRPECSACGGEEPSCTKCGFVLFPRAGHLDCPRCEHNIAFHDGDTSFECDDWAAGASCAIELSERRADDSFDSWDEEDTHAA